jgi:prevent-host-death family protein
VKTIGIYELKAHLSRVLDEVEAGARVLVTRNGEPIAEIVPHRKRRDFDAILKDLEDIRKRSKPVTLEEILAWRHEGHRI